MSYDQVTRDFKDEYNFQDEIYKLKTKLIRYNKILAEKNELHCQLNYLKQWIEGVHYNEKQANKDLFNDLDCQTGKLKKTEESEAVLKAENNDLLNQIDRKTEEICTLKQNEQKLLNEVKELKMNKKEIQNELCKVKGQMEENNCTIERLTKALKSKEQEYFDLKGQLDECRAALCRQSDTCEDLGKTLESTNTNLTNTEFRLKFMQEKTSLEREKLSNELEVMCQNLQTIQIEYHEIKHTIDEEKFNVHKLETQKVNLLEVNEKDRCEANIHIQRLKKDKSAKDENAYRIGNQISDLTRKNECISSENGMLKTQLHGNNSLLEKMKQAIALIDRTKDNHIHQLKRDKDALECDVKQKKKKIDDLKEEMCSFQEKINEIEFNKCFQVTERDICHLKKKIDKLESKYNNNSCPPFKCGPKFSRDTNCKERESNNSYTSNHSKCPAATNECDNSCIVNRSIRNDMKKMYCNMELFKKIHMKKKF